MKENNFLLIKLSHFFISNLIFLCRIFFIFLLCFLLCFILSNPIYSFQYKLSVAAIFKNESLYLKEWIEYHRKIGVEHFYLYNNNSSDDYMKILQQYIDNNIVDLIDWPSETGTSNDPKLISQIHNQAQNSAMTNAINRSKNVTKWLAIIDIDEFIVPVKDSNLLFCLETRFQDCAGVAVNWQCFGTSYVSQLDPKKLMIEQLLLKRTSTHHWNGHFKSIVQPLYVVDANAHFCHYIPGYFHVNTCKNKISPESGQMDNLFIDVLRINHYWTRDELFFYERKLPQYVRWDGEGSRNNYLNHGLTMNEEFDNFILRFVDDELRNKCLP